MMSVVSGYPVSPEITFTYIHKNLKCLHRIIYLQFILSRFNFLIILPILMTISTIFILTISMSSQ